MASASEPSPVLRAYRDADRPEIERMADEIVRDGTVFPFEDRAGVLGYWFSPASHVVVAAEGDSILGSYSLKPNHPGRGAHVCNVGYMTAEAHRRRGIGRRLGEHSIETARALGYRAMQFNQVVSTNETAVRLWKRLGFRVIGEVPGAFRHPELGFVGALIMFREL